MSHEILDLTNVNQLVTGIYNIVCSFFFLSLSPSLLPFFFFSLLPPLPSVFHSLELYIYQSTKHICFHPLGCCRSISPHVSVACSWSLLALTLLGALVMTESSMYLKSIVFHHACFFFFLMVAFSIDSINLTKEFVFILCVLVVRSWSYRQL